jgi:hypothetical protein
MNGRTPLRPGKSGAPHRVLRGILGHHTEESLSLGEPARPYLSDRQFVDVPPPTSMLALSLNVGVY